MITWMRVELSGLCNCQHCLYERNIIQMAIQRVNKGHKVRLLKWD